MYFEGVEKNSLAFFWAQAFNLKECVVIGVVDHVEIWDVSLWQDYYNKASDSFEDIAESLTDFIL